MGETGEGQGASAISIVMYRRSSSHPMGTKGRGATSPPPVFSLPALTALHLDAPDGVDLGPDGVDLGEEVRERLLDDLPAAGIQLHIL